MDKVVSGMMYDTGSVISFTPAELGVGLRVELWEGELEDQAFGMPLIGWGIVVTYRDSWVVETRMEPMAVCCGSLVPMQSHSDEAHRAEGGDHWSYRVVRE